MEMETEAQKFSLGHTVGAATVSVIAFFLLLYIAAPIVEWLLDIFGRLFIPTRMGGGSEVDNPGFLTLLFRGVLVSGLSAFFAFAAGFHFFSDAHVKAVAAVFAIAVLAWAGFLVTAAASVSSAAPLVLIGVGAVPPLVVAYWIWVG